MDSTVSPRLVTSVLALLFCLVASFRTADVKPVRMVTEVVAISMVTPRVASPALAGDAGVLHLGASGGEGNTIALAPIQPSPVPDVVKDTPAGATGGAAPAASRASPEAKPSAQVVRAVARPRARAKPRSKPAQRPPVMARVEAPAPDIPALLVPLRRLGLSIQARLPARPLGMVPAGKPGDPCGPMAV